MKKTAGDVKKTAEKAAEGVVNLEFRTAGGSAKLQGGVGLLHQ